MIIAYVSRRTGLRQVPLATGESLPDDAIWLDLYSPETEECRTVEALLGLRIPTRQEMREIEVSSRLYRAGEAIFMTATVLSSSETELPQASPVTFILTPKTLVTVRYAEPRPFPAYSQMVQTGEVRADSRVVLVGLLEAIVYRAADIIEKIASEVDGVSRAIFEPGEGNRLRGPGFRRVLSRIARYGDLDAKVRESLGSIGRLPAYLAQSRMLDPEDRETHSRLETLGRDVGSLTDHCSFLANKINFLLDATLGLINIDQNATIKIFSVMAVVLLPPTMVASIYGMNFAHMPELDWPFGYPMALLLMLASAVLPYWIFKRRGWL